MLTNKEKEQIIRSSGVNVLKCMRCGKCSGTCPAYDEMEYHPHQFVYMVESGNIDNYIHLVRRRLRLVGSRMELVTRRGAGYRLEADPC